MFGVGKKVSFSVVIAMLLGWAAFSVLFLQASNTLLQAEAYELDRPSPLPSGVKLNFQVDKKVYKAGDTVLISLRNDSRATIWLAEYADGCAGSWWRVEILGSDGETWTPVALTKTSCSEKIYGFNAFTKHSLQTGEWLTVIPSPQLGNIVQPAFVGTYRLVAPYLKGGKVQESDWTENSLVIATSSFTIQ